MSFISLLKRWLRNRRPRHLYARIRDYRRQLSNSRQAVRRWKTEYLGQRSLNKQLRARISSLKFQRDRARQHKKQVLHPVILRQMLRNRAATFSRRSTDSSSQEREKAFTEVSASYAAATAIERMELATRAEQIYIAGLSWWIPQATTQPNRTLRAQAQGLPFRLIAQTREVALGTVMLDIGANIGRTSIPRVILGDFQQIYAAEPDPANYECLVHNVMENNLRGRIFPDHAAIGNSDGETVLMRSKYIGGHRILPEGSRPKHRQLVTVPRYTLDSWVRRLSINVDEITFVKVDTQGWETHILSQATGLLERHHIAWQLEIDPKHLQSSGAPLSRLVEILVRHMTHFIDLNSAAPGSRSRTISELDSALAYVGGATGTKTDILVYHASVD